VSDHVTVDRLQFAFTVTFHYLFPILTMGLALFIFWLKTVSLRRGAAGIVHEDAAHYWGKIFGVTFAVGVVTGIPMEFQFGTNWAGFSNYAGGVIGQTLAMEGVFAFFAESVFLGVFLVGAARVGAKLHWLSSLMLFAGSWISGFFIIATNAWMQHPVAYSLHQGRAQLNSLGGLLSNPWLPWQYAHNMSGAALTGALALAGVGALYALLDRHPDFSRVCLSTGAVGALIFCTLQIFPTGDQHARKVARYQPSSFAAMEAMFETQKGAPLVIIGTPDTRNRRLESTIEMPKVLSFLTAHRWNARLTGLNDIPQDRWPDSIPLVYYAYHIMVGLGTILFAIAALAVLALWRGRLYGSRTLQWLLLLSFPLSYVANIAGWTVAETGRQPWVVFGLMRTTAGASPESVVSAGATLFTLLGFLGLYIALAIGYVLLIARIVARGPAEEVRR
jgi:cytochrome d ubiquinol oxidase subunit I